MKAIKRILVLLFIGCFLFLIYGCTDNLEYEKAEFYQGKVERVELIEYENAGSEFKYSLFNSTVQHTFDESKCTVIETLSAEYNEEFVSRFFIAEKYFSNHDLISAPTGQGLRITLHNGSFKVLTWGYAEGEPAGFTGYYNANGVAEKIRHGFSPLESKYLMVASYYFETQIKLIKY